MYRKLTFVALLLFLLVPDVWGQGCAMCAATLDGADNGTGGFGRGLNTGILMLMTVPYIILFLLFRKQIFRFFKSIRTRKAL